MWWLRKEGLKTNYGLPGSKPAKGEFGMKYYADLPVRTEAQRIATIPESPYGQMEMRFRVPVDYYRLYEQRLRDREHGMLAPIQSIYQEMVAVVVPDPDEKEEEDAIVEVVAPIVMKIADPVPVSDIRDQLSDYLSDYYPPGTTLIPIEPPIRPSTPPPSLLSSDKLLQVQPPIEKKKRGRPRKHQPLPPSPLATHVTSPPFPHNTKLNKSV
jgi:hypothetical protein